MNKTPEQIWEEFQKELEENDKKVQKELYTKTDKEKAKEYAMFIKKNKCKVIGGGKKWHQLPLNILQSIVISCVN